MDKFLIMWQHRVNYTLNKQKKSISGSKILVWGIAYKKDIGDIRKSAALDIIPDLLRKGAKIDYFDPYLKEIELKDGFLEKPVTLRSIEYTSTILKNYDLVLILTDHSGFDYNELAEKANLVVDTRNAIKLKKDKNVSCF